jgi:hypothetical protein
MILIVHASTIWGEAHRPARRCRNFDTVVLVQALRRPYRCLSGRAGLGRRDCRRVVVVVVFAVAVRVVEAFVVSSPGALPVDKVWGELSPTGVFFGVQGCHRDRSHAIGGTS